MGAIEYSSISSLFLSVTVQAACPSVLESRVVVNQLLFQVIAGTLQTDLMDQFNSGTIRK
jgi:hypothetical protein